MADPVLSAVLSGQKAVLLSWTFDSNADFQVFWKSNVPAGQEYVLLATTNAFTYMTPNLEATKLYSFYVRANTGVLFFYSNVVELFISCGKGVVLSAAPPDPPPPQDLGSLFVADTNNSRIVVLTKTLNFVRSTPISPGSGDDQYDHPRSILAYGGYIYVGDTGNCRIKKLNANDLSLVSMIGSFGIGDDQFGQVINSMCTDGTYLYIIDGTHSVTGLNCRVKKHLLSDLSFVSKFGFNTGNPSLGFNVPEGISTDGTYLYIGDEGNGIFKRHLCSDLSYVSHVNVGIVGDTNGGFLHGSTIYGSIMWVENRFSDSHLVKLNKSDLTFVAHFGSSGTGDDQFADIRGDMGNDGTYIYVADHNNHRIKKHNIIDGSFVHAVGTSGVNDGEYNFPYGVSIMQGPV